MILIWHPNAHFMKMMGLGISALVLHKLKISMWGVVGVDSMSTILLFFIATRHIEHNFRF